MDRYFVTETGRWMKIINNKRQTIEWNSRRFTIHIQKLIIPFGLCVFFFFCFFIYLFCFWFFMSTPLIRISLGASWPIQCVNWCSLLIRTTHPTYFCPFLFSLWWKFMWLLSIFFVINNLSILLDWRIWTFWCRLMIWIGIGNNQTLVEFDIMWIRSTWAPESFVYDILGSFPFWFHLIVAIELEILVDGGCLLEL